MAVPGRLSIRSCSTKDSCKREIKMNNYLRTPNATSIFSVNAMDISLMLVKWNADYFCISKVSSNTLGIYTYNWIDWNDLYEPSCLNIHYPRKSD
jgi:hypothetical protein